MKTQTKISLEYLGGFTSTTAEEYRVTKIIGSPTIEVLRNGQYTIVRVGQIITESEAEEISRRIEVTTTAKK